MVVRAFEVSQAVPIIGVVTLHSAQCLRVQLRGVLEDIENEVCQGDDVTNATMKAPSGDFGRNSGGKA